MIPWLLHVSGLDDGSGAWYLFWSGVVGDLVYLGIIFGLLRHANCHVNGCLRPGFHPVSGTPFRVCKRHHPTGGHTVGAIHEAHRRATAPSSVA